MRDSLCPHVAGTGPRTRRHGQGFRRSLQMLPLWRSPRRCKKSKEVSKPCPGSAPLPAAPRAFSATGFSPPAGKPPVPSALGAPSAWTSQPPNFGAEGFGSIRSAGVSRAHSAFARAGFMPPGCAGAGRDGGAGRAERGGAGRTP